MKKYSFQWSAGAFKGRTHVNAESQKDAYKMIVEKIKEKTASKPMINFEGIVKN